MRKIRFGNLVDWDHVWEDFQKWSQDVDLDHTWPAQRQMVEIIVENELEKNTGTKCADSISSDR